MFISVPCLALKLGRTSVPASGERLSPLAFRMVEALLDTHFKAWGLQGFCQLCPVLFSRLCAPVLWVASEMGVVACLQWGTRAQCEAQTTRTFLSSLAWPSDCSRRHVPELMGRQGFSPSHIPCVHSSHALSHLCPYCLNVLFCYPIPKLITPAPLLGLKAISGFRTPFWHSMTSHHL